MKVPLLDLNAQLDPLRDEIKRAVADVIDSTRYVMGPRVEELERKIADYCQVRHGIGVSSGTDALLAALMALDVGHGDVVVTTPFSFFATAGVVARLGATPAFVDIEPESYNMCPRALRRWFEDHEALRDRVKAIMPVHLYGQCADMDPILETARQFDVPVVEDAAQAIGAQYPSAAGPRMAGSMGAMGCLSFYPTKNLGGIGEGGMILTDDDALAEKLRRLRNHGANPKYHHAMIGGNFRLDPVQAAALLVKLPHLDSWHARRREHAAYYDERIQWDAVTTPAVRYRRDCHIYNQYVISLADRRDELQRHLTDNDIGTEIYYPVAFHEQECFQYLGGRRGDFPNAEHAARHTLALPIYPELTPDMQDFVIDTIRGFHGQADLRHRRRPVGQQSH